MFERLRHRRQRVGGLFLAACGLLEILGGMHPAAAAAPQESVAVRHPNLFLNSAEIEAVRAKIKEHAWARDLYGRLAAQAEDTLRGGQEYALYYDHRDYPASDSNTWTPGRRARDLALLYAIGGEPRYADKVRQMLAYYVDTFRDKRITLGSFTDGMGGINLCWAYDLAYDRFAPEERQAFEEFLLRWARQARRPLESARFSNITFWGRAFCGVVGYTLGDRALIEFGITARGGLKEAVDQALRDGALWQEANAYHMLYVSSAMTALAEAAWHCDGTDLYHWTSPQGNSMKGFFDACLDLAFPSELRVTTYGDYSSNSALVSRAEQNTGHQVGDYFLANDADGRDWNKYDLAYRRYRDPAYAFVLAQNPRRDEWDHALWGYLALTHGDPLPAASAPPQAPSRIFPATGIAMLRADESPAYWHSACPAVSVRFGPKVGHGHSDSFHITLHGQAALLEPDWFIQWDYGRTRGGRNPTPWSHHPAAHNTLLVDKRCYPAQQASLEVAGHDFGPDAKWICIRGELYEGVRQERLLLLTREYLLDVFSAGSDARHTYDWLLHGLGDLDLPGLKTEPFDLGADLGFTVIDTACPDGPGNRWIRNGARAAGAAAWSAVWRQPDGRGLRLTMLPDEGAETVVYRGDGPYYVSGNGLKDTFPDRDQLTVPLVLARRQAAATTFIALHEPLAAAARPAITLQRTADRPELLRLRVEGPSFRDSFDYVRAAGDRQEPQVTFLRTATP